MNIFSLSPVLLLLAHMFSGRQAATGGYVDSAVQLRMVREVTTARIRTPPAKTIVRASSLYGDAELFARLTGAVERRGALVAADSRTSPHLFRFSAESRNLTHSGARQGSGPGEVLYPASVFSSPDSNAIGVYDFNLRRIAWFDIRNLKEVGRTVSLKHAGSLAGVIPDGDGFLANPISADVSLIRIRRDGEVSGSFTLTAPFGPPEVSNPTARRLLNVSAMATNQPSASKVVLAYQMTSDLDIIDLRTRTFVRVHGPRKATATYRFVPPQNRFKWEDSSENAYVGVTATSSRIYALFSGARDDEKRYGARLIHAFDWEGRFLGEFALDRDASFVAMAQDRSSLLIGTDTPWPAVARAAIPSELR